MKWSRYNCFFKSDAHGWLLYNSGSNAFVQCDEDTAREIQTIAASPGTYDFTANPGLYIQLKNSGFLVEERQDDDLFNITKMRHLTHDIASPHLMLTIAPTRACNFGCPYCYEKDRKNILMSEKTEKDIIKFISLFSNIKKISLYWYGGEPLLALKKILSLNKKIAALNISYDSIVITNGYLITPDFVETLKILKTTAVQITLDGDEDTHNARRFLLDGGKTYAKIISNIDLLMKSDWEGLINIRVNVDTSNYEQFVRVHTYIKTTYGKLYGKKITVYPGFVHDITGNPDISCCMDKKLQAEFLLKLANDLAIADVDLFPSKYYAGCTALQRNAYVIGPEGELYKCWDDIGVPEFVIGSISALDNWNMGLVAEYMVGTSYLNDPECRSCFFFPICDGGCPKARLMNKRRGISGDTCSYYKTHLKQLLELHYDRKIRSENKPVRKTKRTI